MESLAYTYSALAWEEETPELRKVNWVGATSALAIVASVNSGVAYGNEMYKPQSFDTPDSTELVSDFSDDSEFDYSSSTIEEMVSPEIFTIESSNPEQSQDNWTESVAIAGEVTPPETISENVSLNVSLQKQTKSNLTQSQESISQENIEIANKSYGYYPRPYYSRTKIPDHLKISPFNLVYRAYNGGFRDSGIPGFKNFMNSTQSGKIDATDLIRAGIIQGRLTTQDLYDPGYVTAVRAYLKGLRG